MKIIAIDPGGTTGWAAWTSNRISAKGSLRVGEVTGPNHHRKLYQVLDRECNDYLPGSFTELAYDPPLIVIYERWYRDDDDAAEEVPSNEYNGVVKLWCQNNEIVPVPQGASGVVPSKKVSSVGGPTAFCTDDKLKALHIYNDYKKPHATDAIRHIIFWLINGTHDYDQYRDELLKELKANLK